MESLFSSPLWKSFLFSLGLIPTIVKIVRESVFLATFSSIRVDNVVPKWTPYDNSVANSIKVISKVWSILEVLLKFKDHILSVFY